MKAVFRPYAFTSRAITTGPKPLPKSSKRAKTAKADDEATTHAWSWPEAEKQAPPVDRFPRHGVAHAAFGAKFAAPGAPADKASLYGVLQFRDQTDNCRESGKGGKGTSQE